MVEVHAALVAAIGGSVTRSTVYQWWVALRAVLGSIIAFQRQWVGGSFATSKVDPGDIDLVTILDGPTYDSLPVPVRQQARLLLGGHTTRDAIGCDSFPLFEYPAGHIYRPHTEAAFAYWHRFWGHRRPGPGGVSRTRGYLEVT